MTKSNGNAATKKAGRKNGLSKFRGQSDALLGPSLALLPSGTTRGDIPRGMLSIPMQLPTTVNNAEGADSEM